MAAFLLWCLLFIVCWPLALFALIAYPFVWLVLLPFGSWELRSTAFLDFFARFCFCRYAFCVALTRSKFVKNSALVTFG